jgi:hypothetical protein
MCLEPVPEIHSKHLCHQMNSRFRAVTPKVLVQMEYVVLLPMFLESHETLDLLTMLLNVIVGSNLILVGSSPGKVWRSNLARYPPPFLLLAAACRARAMSTAKYAPKATFSQLFIAYRTDISKRYIWLDVLRGVSESNN